MIIKNIIRESSRILKNHNIPSHDLDAEIISSHVLKVKREFLITNDLKNISNSELCKIRYAINRRIKREPIAYITGKKEFWSQDFTVNKYTLVPRPETELMIYKIINYFKNKKITILDMGTGSGCILLSILKELKNSNGTGIDISPQAIKIAKKNSKKLNLYKRSKFKVFDINKFFLGNYDLVVSNPPYISSIDMVNLEKDIKNYEPAIALDGGKDGLKLIKKVIYRANKVLKRKGLLALEIGFNQYIRVKKLLTFYGFRELGKEYDYKRNIRCIISTKL